MTPSESSLAARWPEEHFDIFPVFGGVEVLDRGGEGIEPRAKGRSVHLDSVGGGECGKGAPLFQRAL